MQIHIPLFYFHSSFYLFSILSPLASNFPLWLSDLFSQKPSTLIISFFFLWEKWVQDTESLFKVQDRLAKWPSTAWAESLQKRQSCHKIILIQFSQHYKPSDGRWKVPWSTLRYWACNCWYQIYICITIKKQQQHNNTKNGMCCPSCLPSSIKYYKYFNPCLHPDLLTQGPGSGKRGLQPAWGLSLRSPWTHDCTWGNGDN